MIAEALVLDSNLLVVLVVGSASIDFIGAHKNTRAYSKSDFSILLGLVTAAKRILTTPNILTETSNLARQFGEPARSRIIELLGEMIEPLDELYVESVSSTKAREFKWLGLTDCGILEMLKPDHLLLTADYDLYMAACSRGHNVINFNHLRE